MSVEESFSSECSSEGLEYWVADNFCASSFGEIRTNPVIHAVFGVGRITEIDDFFVTVEFSEKTAKFLYPEAFLHYLRFQSHVRQREMRSYLRRMGDALRMRSARRCRADGGGDLRYDEVEDTLRFMEVNAEVEAKIKRQDGGRRFMGYCHLFWMKKKSILKEEYGIDWRTPSEMNPYVMFD